MGNNNHDDDFLKVFVNYGLVIKADLETLTKIKEFLANLPDVHIIYQVVDGGKLWIKREGEE